MGEVTETVGQRLKRLREERGLSQRELSVAGVTYAYISRIEAGERNPSVKALRRLAERLEVSVQYLEHGDERLTIYLTRTEAMAILTYDSGPKLKTVLNRIRGQLKEHVG